MKTLAYYLLGIFSLCLLNACSDEENPTPEPPPSKGQEEVQKIVEVLKESNPEVSQFVEILEKVNVADLTQDELTVFAVKTKYRKPCCRIGYRFHQKSHRQRTLCQRGFNRWQYPDQYQ